MTAYINRRALLRGGAGLAGLGISAALLAACGDGDESTSSGGESGGVKDLGALNYQLSWIKNVEFAGAYIADTKGYYKDAGFSSVNLMSGGPTVSQDAVVAAGKALVGISSPDITAAAILKGADLVILGAQYQKNPFAIVSLKDTPINTPQDMVGKKIGVQATNEPVWNAFLKANNIDPASVTKVPAQFDPTPLVSKEVDGWFSFFTNEPNLLKTKGVETAVMLLNDHGYPMVSEVYVVKRSSLTSDRDKLKALLVADIKGWTDSLADPALGANLAATKYGKDLGLDEKEQVLESEAQNTVVQTEDTKANGLFTITDAHVEETIATLALGGVTITKEQLFDLSVIKEVYEENPNLKAAS
ncbi:ABC-type nitrate/sulfonate/bicarbonate transport system substrate-binding protein [Actinoplanes lutulentus]|uniref:Thiamine pyrimidine synthase n=1 Tax=Actinoplanes lutulentus TaxID=1287878 RepID=A0A327ZI84_9ACTN|nr:ABC transporter substrate-binding protein [Actinoplanes lutulentus]MBB2947980.1 ABC-type nitrate/sulfonate/bicarbonate transport system substrate-binding protein [Actinoplanes lutulentus]RAK40139.1 ABC-type nitrate/sulfonate/bicarbonate transport system substrate-binding protein [Actinoplanes lutulentus]